MMYTKEKDKPALYRAAIGVVSLTNQSELHRWLLDRLR